MLLRQAGMDWNLPGGEVGKIGARESHLLKGAIRGSYTAVNPPNSQHHQLPILH
jgi:hypothetical protein